MDGAASKAEEEAPPPTGDGESSAEVEKHRQQEKHPAPPPLPGGVHGDAAVNVECGGDEEEEDKQVERFFALLANIRALRAMYGAAFARGTAGRGRKRARDAEPPWRPAFRLEDFAEERHVKAMRSAVRTSRTWTGAVADDHGQDDGEVVETSSCPVAASQRASDVC